MFNKAVSLIVLAFVVFHVPTGFAETSPAQPLRPCDTACRREKIEALFQEMDKAAASRRPKPSQSTECSSFEKHDSFSVLMDVCAKLKFVRSIPAGTATNFSCPENTSSLIALAASRVQSMWGKPDSLEIARSLHHGAPGTRWTYFIGSPRQGELGGGFPELSLRLVNGNVVSVSCHLSE